MTFPGFLAAAALLLFLALPLTAEAAPEDGGYRALLESLTDAAGGEEAQSPQISQACCKTCRKGKACGDSCIAREKTCEKPKGCACDARALQ